ncbi:alpha/beta-type small acid-soluble spore protein [Oceanirhabdus sp. W0125-5]|uniref:alpha/beta-type small acid-soluble spore protein n=1 Tax=Oceanirhabdus sp. W0125-5 TaxID=2999116 RepID=UPI0022F3394F|nr:alpha/beta-type small acid-soluble spore protein [Oceanirhabdus sp. W0125-5]WBW96968.1 alpha/beta-type small acid-soluble spore protein [Oceanirhabdus sp. W0125-5]
MTNRPVVPGKEGELDRFKMEVARDLHVDNQLKNNKNNHPYMGNITSEVAGKMTYAGNVGGEMTRRMIKAAEEKMARK